ncbi:hypothetical protein ACTG9Q_17100 [Actinokineospora sp. 24-640]
MKRFLIPAALLVLATAGACGERPDAVPEIPGGASLSLTMPTKPSVPVAPPTDTVDPTGPSVSLGPSGVVVPSGYTELPAGQVDAKALPADVYTDRRVWAAPDGRSLQLFAVAPDPCTEVRATVESAGADVVTLALSPVPHPLGGPEGQVCATVVTPKPVSVRLADVLGDRKVVLTEGP